MLEPTVGNGALADRIHDPQCGFLSDSCCYHAAGTVGLRDFINIQYRSVEILAEFCMSRTQRINKATYTASLHSERDCTLSFVVIIGADGADVMEGRVDIIGLSPMIGDRSRASEVPLVVGSIIVVIFASEIIVIGPIPGALAVPVPKLRELSSARRRSACSMPITVCCGDLHTAPVR